MIWGAGVEDSSIVGEAVSGLGLKESWVKGSFVRELEAEHGLSFHGQWTVRAWQVTIEYASPLRPRTIKATVFQSVWGILREDGEAGWTRHVAHGHHDDLEALAPFLMSDSWPVKTGSGEM